jgi:hypothetical protein
MLRVVQQHVDRGRRLQLDERPAAAFSPLRRVDARLYAVALVTGRKDGDHGRALKHLGLRLMEESKPVAGRPMRLADAVCYRDGLMTALCPFIRSAREPRHGRG